MRAVDERTRIWAEQRRTQTRKGEFAGVVAVQGLLRCVSLVDQSEQNVEGVLKVPRVARMIAVEFDERGIPQARHAVPGLVVGVIARQDPELGTRLCKEQ